MDYIKTMFKDKSSASIEADLSMEDGRGFGFQKVVISLTSNGFSKRLFDFV